MRATLRIHKMAMLEVSEQARVNLTVVLDARPAPDHGTDRVAVYKPSEVAALIAKVVILAAPALLFHPRGHFPLPAQPLLETEPHNTVEGSSNHLRIAKFQALGISSPYWV